MTLDLSTAHLCCITIIIGSWNRRKLPMLRCQKLITKNMENIVLHLKLVRGMRGTPLAYAVWCHIKVTHILPGYHAYLNLEGEMITRAPIVNSRSNLKLSQKTLESAYLDHQCDTNIDNALVYQILLKMFMDIDAYVYMKKRKRT